MITVPRKDLSTYLLIPAIMLHTTCFTICAAQNGSSLGNPCDAFGECGPFGSCDQHTSPICSCLQGFDPRNNQEWDAGNWTSGCERSVPLNCEGTSNGGRQDGFLRLQMMKISGYSERWIAPRDQCEGRCVRNCSCIAYAFDAGIGCMFWSGTFIDIQKFSSSSGSDFYIRLANSELDQKKNSKNTMVIIIVVVVVLSVLVFILFYFLWRRIAKTRGRDRREPAMMELSGAVDSLLQGALDQVNNPEELPFFKFEVLANATDKFSEANKLGKGGFGPVYKGELANGRNIAVKRLSKASGQGMQEFRNEVLLISKLQHRNLVRLLGYCVQNKETMLVYEYMPNKSLDFFLFDPSQDALDWGKRFNIIEGICRGLLYLHRDSRLKIIHRDLKPSNILLDNDWNPKISDFGMARIYGTSQDHVSTVRVVGTYGYMAPEYAIEGRFSEKSDVFSFGVLMLEITTGRRNSSFHHQEGSLNLVGHAWKLWNEDNIGSLIDPRISSGIHKPQVVRCIHIALLCVQELPIDRPSISAVLSMLRSQTVELPEPKQSAFVIKSRRSSEAGTSSAQRSQKSISDTLNNVTLTVVDGR